ncbi:PPC domain-containing protein, partial [Vibrio parahaemolyticus]|nr:PPC domain-containing protein [Vibrio parahaemolyticus]
DLYMSYNKVAHYYDFEMSQYADGSNEEIVFEPEQDGYVKAGRYYISLTGRDSYDSVNLVAALEVEAQTPPTQVQDDLAPVVLESGEAKMLTVHKQRYAAVHVPEGVEEVRVWLTAHSQTGNVDLYASREHWPTVEQHEYASNYAGSNEYLAIPVTEAGYVHFALQAPEQGDDVEMLVHFN